MNILIVDDEPLARARLRTLLSDCTDPLVQVVLEASHAQEAWLMLQGESVDLLLLDIHMPGLSGMDLAEKISTLPHPPAVVFVTAHPEHAVRAFEVHALDYLTKPVRLERLQQALRKCPTASPPKEDSPSLLIQERHRSVRVPIQEVLYFKAELKYVTVRTATKTYLLEGALTDLEEKYAHWFLRVHRNALVARAGIRTLEKAHDNAQGEVWAIRLEGIQERLFVSRRQLPSVREMLRNNQN